MADVRAANAFRSLAGDLPHLLPRFIRNVLTIGPGAVDAGTVIQQSRGASVSALDCSAEGIIDSLPLVTLYDSVIFNATDALPDAWDGIALALRSVLQPRGYLLIVNVLESQIAAGESLQFASTQLMSAGLATYLVREIQGNSPAASLASAGYVLIAVHESYNPLEHARELVAEERPSDAHEILELIPDFMCKNDRTKATVAVEKMKALLEWDRLGEPNDRVLRFFQTQLGFFDAIAAVPDISDAYLLQSEFWRRVGDVDMADRLLSTLQRLTPMMEIPSRVEIPSTAAPQLERFDSPAEWSETGAKPHILFILPPRPHYGVDVLYDGLCAVLGDENVVDFPFKPTLHGASPPDGMEYPCLFNRLGTASNLEDVIEKLKEGVFDFVLFGDLDRTLPPDEARALAGIQKVPWFLVDQEDDPVDHANKMLAYLQRDSFHGHFKREMLRCVNYGDGVYPLPFSYPESRIPTELPTERTVPLFWAGHRRFGLRRPYLDRLEAKLKIDFRRHYSQNEYRESLLNAQIGLNLFGYGFDTVRYWELPAHGCALLSERLPIHVPHDFEDNVSAFFFEDLLSLEEKIDYCVNHPEAVRAVGLSSHQRLHRYHTSAIRARQMLGGITKRLKNQQAKG